MSRGRSQPNSPNAVNVWCEYLNVSPDDPSALYRMVAEVVQLPGAAIDALDLFDTGGVPLEKFSVPVEKIGQSIISAATRRVSAYQFSAGIDGAHLAQLEISSFMFNHARPNTSDEPTTLEEIRKLAAELRVLLVQDESLDSGFRLHTLQTIERLQRSLDLYKIGGLDAVAAEVDKLVGATVRHHAGSGEGPGQLYKSKLLQLVHVIAVVTTLYSGPATVVTSTEVYQELLSEAVPIETLAPGESRPQEHA